jgi:hypothetical protein
MQESITLQRLPSLHIVPSGALGLLHIPVAASQVPATWHWSDGMHVVLLPPTQAPFWHESIWLQALLSLHAVPSGALGLSHIPVIGLQVPAM